MQNRRQRLIQAIFNAPPQTTVSQQGADFIARWSIPSVAANVIMSVDGRDVSRTEYWIAESSLGELETRAKQQAGSAQYRIETTPRNPLKYEASLQPVRQYGVEGLYVAFKSLNGDSQYGMNKTGGSLQVFAGLMDALKRVVTRFPGRFRFFNFSAEGESRQKLYRGLLRRFLPGYQIRESPSGGGVSFLAWDKQLSLPDSTGKTLNWLQAPALTTPQGTVFVKAETVTWFSYTEVIAELASMTHYADSQVLPVPVKDVVQVDAQHVRFKRDLLKQAPQGKSLGDALETQRQFHQQQNPPSYERAFPVHEDEEAEEEDVTRNINWNRLARDVRRNYGTGDTDHLEKPDEPDLDWYEGDPSQDLEEHVDSVDRLARQSTVTEFYRSLDQTYDVENLLELVEMQYFDDSDVVLLLKQFLEGNVEFDSAEEPYDRVIHPLIAEIDRDISRIKNRWDQYQAEVEGVEEANDRINREVSSLLQSIQNEDVDDTERDLQDLQSALEEHGMSFVLGSLDQYDTAS